jgi:hypothetical protein
MWISAPPTMYRTGAARITVPGMEYDVSVGAYLEATFFVDDISCMLPSQWSNYEGYGRSQQTCVEIHTKSGQVFSTSRSLAWLNTEIDRVTSPVVSVMPE